MQKMNMPTINEYIRLGVNSDIVSNNINELWKNSSYTPSVLSLVVENLISRKEIEDALAITDIATNKFPNSKDIEIISLQTKRKAGIFNDQILKRLLELQVNFLSRSDILYSNFQLLWDYNGMTYELRQQISLLLKIKEKLSINQILRIASCLTEMGEYSLARTIVHETKFPYKIKSTGYIYLDGILGSEFKINNMVPFEIYNSLLQTQDEFISIIKDGDFAVVGNSPTLLRSGNGKLIDSFKYIIRFNNFSVEGNYRDDVGSKTNIWVKSGYYRDINRKYNSNFQLIIQASNNPCFRTNSFIDFIDDAYFMDSKITFIPPNIYRELMHKIGRSPSAGLCILYWIYSIRGFIDSKQCFGFSMGSQAKNISEHYFSDYGKRTYQSHDWNQESKIMEYITI